MIRDVFMKKFLSVLMVAVLLFLFAFTGTVSADDSDVTEIPVFAVSQKEAPNGFIKLCFSLESGSFNSLNINFIPSQGLICSDISTSSVCASNGWAATNKTPAKGTFNVSIVSTEGYSATGPIFYVTYQITDTGLNDYSVSFKIGECIVAHSVNGTLENTRVDPVDPVFSRNNLEIRVAARPVKTTYCVGQTIDTKGLSVYALTLNGKVEIISGYSLSYDFSSAGQKTVTVCYLPNQFYAEATFEVTVKDHIPGEYSEVESPTCSKAGLRQAACVDCGRICRQETIPALSHTPGQFEIVKNPTCSETGLKEACCTVCSTKCDSKIIPVKSHTLETIISKLPTYKETGEKLTKCSACGHIQKTVSIPKTSADINGDKSVTSKDALLILQHATGLKMLKGTSLANADLNGSGTVFSDDALLVLQLATGLITA